MDVFYHGGARFETFDLAKAADGGLFFTRDSWLAAQFMKKDGRLYAANLQMNNPKTVAAESFGYWDRNERGEGVFIHDPELKRNAIALAKQEGFDSLIVKAVPEGGEDFEPSDQFVVFSAEQVLVLMTRDTLGAA
jgi:hypothetical protein